MLKIAFGRKIPILQNHNSFNYLIFLRKFRKANFRHVAVYNRVRQFICISLFSITFPEILSTKEILERFTEDILLTISN